MLGGTASYLLGMSPIVASHGDSGIMPENVKKLSLGWMMGFLFVVSFVGLFSIVPLRKVISLPFFNLFLRIFASVSVTYIFFIHFESKKI